MSIIRPGHPQHTHLPECFYCGRPIRRTAIVWSGTTAEVRLHPACVVQLSIRLLRDVHQLECEDHCAVGLVSE